MPPNDVSPAQIAKYESNEPDNIVKNTEYINAKTRELYQMPGTNTDAYRQQYNQTMIAGVMWTVLATSLAYYVFNEL